MNFARVSGIEPKKRATELPTLVGLADRIDHFPDGLSGGQKQRVAIARVLANDPKLMLADEPTGNLDYANTDQVMQIFKDLHNEVETVFLIVTHSQHVASYADRHLELSDGTIIGQHGSGSDLYSLAESRSVVVSESGNLTLLPELLGALDQYGLLWNFTFDINGNGPRIIGKPSIRELDKCPVCNADLNGDKFNCNSYGAKLN